MQVVGRNVFAGGRFAPAVVDVRGGRIASVRALDGEPAPAVVAEGGETVDAGDGYVIPGLIDLHFHGAMGADLCDGTPESIAALARYEASRGVTGICPATMTFPESVLAPVMDAAAAFSPADDEAALLGINMEGPFISPNKVGAQNPAYVQRADAAMIRRLQERAGGLVKLVDVAPEEPGALEFIREMAGEVRISIAHTCADYGQAAAAFEAGARHVTHMCNAMPPLHHRDPGPIGAAFDFAQSAGSEDFFAEVICDGKHVSPTMIRLLFKLFDGRLCVISDSTMAAGMPDGDYKLGGQDISVHDSLAWLTPTTIAGGVTNIGECLRRLVAEMGVDPAQAVTAASENPARALGVFDERGSIEAGKAADLVVLDKHFAVKQVILRGKLLKSES